MQQLPKIVKERLQAIPRSDHPDADVLTAFAEQSLPNSERSLVMEHLARCSDCREVLALALPELEEAVAPAALRRPWLSLPMLRWGAIAAVFVVLVSVGVVRYRPDSSKNMASALPGPKNEMISAVNTPLPSATEARQRAVLVKPSFSPSAVQMKTAEKETVARSNGVQAQGTNSNALALRRAMPSTGRSQPGLAASTANGSEPKQPPANEEFVAGREHTASSIPSQTETEVASASPALSTEQSALGSNQGQTQVEIQQSQTSPEQQADQELQSETRAVVGKAKAPVALPATPSPARNLGGASQMPQVAPFSAPGPRWKITPMGGLRRSYDQGKTWQDIYVTANQSPASVALQAEGGYAQKAAQTKKQQAWASPVFRAISASGMEIWAGADGGVLYHSVDAGDHWTSAVPSDGGIVLTGDVISVQFTDSLHGRISTSTSEMWATSDGGRGWSKQ
jgi:hypothetical protein